MWAALGVLALLATLLTPLTTASAQPTAPGKPTVTATPGDKSVTLSWGSVSDGGTTILRWEYQQTTPATNLWVAVPNSGPGTTRHTVTGLRNGTEYGFQVRAVNGVGDGEASDVVTATPSTTPAAPTNLRGTPGNSQIVLTWTAGDNGSSPITSYEIQQKTGSGDYTDWALIIGSGADTATHTVTGLTNGTAYTFKVRAVNINGKGAAAESQPVLAATTPGTPRSLTATAGDKTATLSWTAGGNGGSPIIGWQFRQTTDGTLDGEVWVAIPDSGPDTTSYTVISLDNASTYHFGVRAVNAIGAGTEAVTAQVDPGKVPAKPASLTAALKTGTVDTVTLTWSYAETNPDGGSPILRMEYSQKANDGDYGEWKAIPNSRGTGTTTYDVKGLTAGTAYMFQVRAVNATGAGPALATAAPVYPGTFPAAPGNLRATAAYDAAKGAATVTLSWTAGNNGGSPVTKWEYAAETLAQLGDLANEDGDWITICESTTARPNPACASTTSVTLPRPTQPTNLRPDGELVPAAGGSYVFIVRAVNTHGNGLSSAVARTSFSVSAPSAPRGVHISATNLDSGNTPPNPSISLIWVAPASTGGSAITGYEYSMKTGSGAWGAWQSAGGAGATTATISAGVNTGTAYQFRVRARNALGAGAHAESAVSTPGAPGTPGGTSGTPSIGTTVASTQVTIYLKSAVGETSGCSGCTGSTTGQTRWEYSYKVGDGDYGQWAHSNTGADLASSVLIDGLTNGAKHTFRVRALNGAASSPILESMAVTPGTAPPAPANLKAEGGNGTVTLTWTSAGDGGSAITKWQSCGGTGDAPLATCGADGDGWTDIANSGPTTNSHTLGSARSPLTNGSAYTYRVRAVNSAGNGAMAQASPATPGKAPEKPTRVQVTAGDASVTVKITANDAGNNGSQITAHQISKQEAGGAYDAWETVARKKTGATTYEAVSTATVTGLTNGVTYTFKVRAVNAYGSGASIASVAVTPVGAPPKGAVSAEAGNGSVTLTWSSGGSGGSDITGWQYRQQQGGSGYGAWMDIEDSGPGTTSHTVTGLSNGISYTFQVRAVNKLGTGDPSESNSASPSTVPPQPASVVAERGDGQVTVTWSAGASGSVGEADYAAPTTEWHVRMKADDGDYGDWMAIADSDADTTSYTATGLTNGTAYVFQVRAMNVMGDGDATTSNAATPATTPSAPTVSVTDGDGSAVVSWTAGDDGGSAVTAWHIQVNGGDWVDMTARGLPLGVTAAPVPGLDDGTAYTFGIRGVNDVGAGAAGSADLAANSAPGAPTVSASGSDGSITVSWTAGDDGGSSITGWHYRMKVSISEYGDWMDADGTSVTLSDLDSGTGVLSYTFQVRGVNGVGEGEAGTSNAATPIDDPAVNGMYYSGVITGPNFCAEMSLGGARLFAFDSDGDGVADTCALPFTKREAIARQNAVATLASQHAAAYVALVNAACATVEGDAACGGDTLSSPGVPPINDGGPYYSGTITGPSYCANMSLGGPVTYPFDSDGDGVADTCAYPYTTREAIARQLAGDVLAALNSDAFKAILQDECRRLGGADYGDDPAHLAEDACA